jgi:tetratricopeptide (TPR) repeat protein
MRGFTSGNNLAAKNLALGLAAGALFLGGLLAERPALAEGRHYRSYGPVYRGPARPYYRRYFGPTYYGSVYYALTTPRFLPPAPPMISGGYGYGSVFGNPVFGNGNLPPLYGPYFGGNPYANTPYSAYRPPSSNYFDPYSNTVLQESMLENQLRWGMNLPPNGMPTRSHVRLRPSTPEQQAKSIHAQAQGDVYMHRLKFLNAYERYKVAMNAANDRPEPYFRLGYALAAVGSYDSAVKYIKEGLELYPQWPAHGERLEGIFGDDNRLAILSLIERVTGWVRDDIRDPDRLFLVGVLLHFNGDNRANAFFEAAYRLAGGGDHLLAFLQPQPENKETVGGPAQPGAPRGPYDNAPPPPAPVEPPLTLDQIPGAALNPPGTNGPSPVLSPRPPATTNPVPPLPSGPRLPGGALDQPPSNEGTPSGPPPQRSQPPSALPLPPLPAPAEPAPAPQLKPQPSPPAKPQPSAQAPTGGPVLTPTSVVSP